MTKTEAIEWLEKAKAETTAIAKDIPTTGEYANSLITAIELVDALNMAIETLQHEQERREDIYECPNCTGEVHNNYIYCPFCGIKVESDE